MVQLMVKRAVGGEVGLEEAREELVREEVPPPHRPAFHLPPDQAVSYERGTPVFVRHQKIFGRTNTGENLY